MFKYIILVINIASVALSAKILAIVPTGSYSHQVAFQDFWKELSLRGHQVTLITANPQKNEKLTNLTEIDVSLVYRLYTDISDVVEESLTMWNFHEWVHDLTVGVAEVVLSYSTVQELIHAKKEHFDVVILEYFYPEFLGFAEKYNCPTILVASLELLAKYQDLLGNPSHPALYPNMGTSFNYPLSFKERIISTIYYLKSTYFYDYESFPARDRILQKFFNSSSTVTELAENVDLAIVTVHPVIQTARAVGPTTINTGSLRLKKAVPLPKVTI